MSGRPDNLQPMETAPQGPWITLWYVDSISYYPIAAHFAQALSGEEQAPFRGWFQWCGFVGGGIKECPANPIGWTA